ncbi:MAG TPA: Ig-like domain-containing protein, partial [Edaphobacter sp.]|nr:Ig-like domain-containing protein [Edaphobacter sp.]
MAMLTFVLLAGMGCANMSLTAIDVTPSSDTQILNRIGEKAQFTAIGTYTGGKHLPRTEDLTQQVTWASSDTSVATVDAGGAVTAVGSGTALITASAKGGLGVVQGTSNVKVTVVQRTLVSLAIVPGNQPLGSIGETAQFLAIGTYSSGSPITQDLTNQ